MARKPYYQDKFITLYLGDSEEIISEIIEPIDLVLTDPPYGIGEAFGKNKSRGKLAVSKDYGNLDWDNKTANQNFINELIQKPAIIFGGNYYQMPPNACWFVWDKKNGETDFADCELAWTNLPGAVRQISYMWHGMLREIPEKRFHPTQKPLEVMKWCILQADKKLKSQVKNILDPFAGSGTTLIAAKNLNRNAIGIEIEEQYCEIIAKRLSQEVLIFDDN